jgi:membrane fusion protein, multidrug efflux system
VVKRSESAAIGSLALALPILALVMMAGCSRGGNDERAAFMRQAVPVTVASAVQEPVAHELHEIGTVEAYSTVNVKAQITGQVISVHFREGQDVKKGDLLFTIDPRPFKAELDRARANLASDEAKLKQAEDEERRWAELLKEGIGSQEQYDSTHATAGALRAAVDADKAAVRTAQLNLGYCTIASPIDGRTGTLVLHAGNIVKANDDKPMVTINQVRPVYVDFSVPEKDLGEIRRQMGSHRLEVDVTLPGQKQSPVRGDLSFIDNTVNTTTGTIALKGLFHNQDERLWPGQFVDVSLKLGELPNAVLVPSQAVQMGQEGTYLFVVGHDMKAEIRKVVTGESFGDKIVIERGLKAGETVVTDGQLRLFPGAKVKVKQSRDGREGVTS